MTASVPPAHQEAGRPDDAAWAYDAFLAWPQTVCGVSQTTYGPWGSGEFRKRFFRYGDRGRPASVRGRVGFLSAASSVASLPPGQGLEVAFAGRSNVGKSSLINALTGRRSLARTSNTPGRTQELIFFRGSGPLVLVDLPGYGYAAAAKSKFRRGPD